LENQRISNTRLRAIDDAVECACDHYFFNGDNSYCRIMVSFWILELSKRTGIVRTIWCGEGERLPYQIKDRRWDQKPFHQLNPIVGRNDSIFAEPRFTHRDLERLKGLEHRGIVVSSPKRVPGGIRQRRMEHFSAEATASHGSNKIERRSRGFPFLRWNAEAIVGQGLMDGLFDEVGCLAYFACRQVFDDRLCLVVGGLPALLGMRSTTPTTLPLSSGPHRFFDGFRGLAYR